MANNKTRSDLVAAAAPVETLEVHKTRDERGNEIEVQFVTVDGKLVEVSRRRTSANDDLIGLIAEAVDSFIAADVRATAIADEQVIKVKVGEQTIEVDGKPQKRDVHVDVLVPPPVIHTSVSLEPNAAARLANTIVARLRAQGVEIPEIQEVVNAP